MAVYGSHRLAELVHKLCKQLGRPVSSRDLLHYFRNDPDSRPLLFQRPGQLLFKLAQRKHRMPMLIHRIGIISNLAFYAPTGEERWVEAFHAYRDSFLLKEQIYFRMPEHITRLMGTRFEALGRNALAGFIAEFEPLHKQCGNFNREVADDFSILLEQAKSLAYLEFILTLPEKLISRASATELLSKSYASRMQMTTLAPMSAGRHLVHLQWPQSSFLGEPSGHYWEDQVVTYCASRWPINNAESSLARGLSLAMRYGQGPVGAILSNASTTDDGSGKLA